MGRLKIVGVAEAGFVTCQKASTDLTFTDLQYRTLIPLLQDLSSLPYLHVCHQMLFHHCVFDTFFSVFVAAAAVNPSLEYLLVISYKGESQSFLGLARHIRFRNLRAPRLHWIVIKIASLRAFLVSTAPLVKTLTLASTNLTESTPFLPSSFNNNAIL